MRNKILVLCHDTVGHKMAGPGIRYQNIAGQLKSVANVTLAVFSESENESAETGIKYVSKSGGNYKQMFDQNDIIFAQWLSAEMLSYAHGSGKILIFDLYAPVPIEYLASLSFSTEKITPEHDLEFSGILETYSKYLSTGDFFVCSNERQRDFWIGYAAANGLVKPSNFREADLLDKFALGPMGISSKPPKREGLKLRSSLKLKADDFVLLWTGGIWDWFDARVAIQAVADLSNPKVKLVFLGTKHPNNVYKEEMNESLAARQLADNLGLINKSVFFLDGWVPYDERAAYLLDSDAAIYADKQSLETRFSHRTRVLDHIWTELPTICSSGDYMAEVVERYGFGLTVTERTATEFAEAIKTLANDKRNVTRIKKNIGSRKYLFTWEKTLAPLISYVDQVTPRNVISREAQAPAARLAKPRFRGRVRKAAKILIKGQ